MREQIEQAEREAVLVEDTALIRMMGIPVLEALPSRAVPYAQVDRSSSCTRRASGRRTWRT